MTEGAAATFTVTAAEPAPAGGLAVNLTVSESSGSDYVDSDDEGAQTVTIPANATSATYSVATVNDSADEPHGTVTVTVETGTGYMPGTTASAEVVVKTTTWPWGRSCWTPWCSARS